MINKRLNNVSLLRVFAMLLIFAHHVLCGYFVDADMGLLYFPSSMGVEIFLFISAFLYGNKTITNFKSFFSKRFLFIFLPYYIFIILFAIFYVFYNPSVFNTWEILQGTFCLYIFDSSFHPLRHFWFLPIIMLCYCIIPLLQKYYNNDTSAKTKKLLSILFITIIVAEIALSFNKCHLQFTAFLIGYYVAKNKDYNSISYKKSIPSFIIIALIYFLLRGSNLIPNIFSICDCLGQICTLFMGVLFSLIILKAFNFLNEKPTNKFLKISDKISYPFYIVHQIFLIGSLSLLKITDNLILNILFAFIVCCVFGFILYCLQTIILKLFSKKNKPKTKTIA